MINEKCFALTKSGDCRALELENCPGYAQCSFYVPKWKYARDLKRVDIRLCSLTALKQREIADKYYHGNMPWRKETE